MKQNSHIPGFTLIELIVSITIFSIVMVSVISIFIFASQLSAKIEINRIMQENIKNIVETISEDVRGSGLQGVSPSVGDLGSCSGSTFSGPLETGGKLCTKTSEYFLGKHDDAIGFIRVDPATSCSDLKDQCLLVRKHKGEIFPLSNSHISFRDLKFHISGEDIPKVTIVFYAQPSVRKGVQSNLIQENTFYFQTTISERLIELE